MSLNLEGKKAIVTEVAEVAGSAKSAVAAEYRGLTAGELTRLRAEARKAGVYLRVVRNTLARRAVEKTEYECLQDTLTGPLMLAFSTEDATSAPRVMSDFAKEFNRLIIKAGAFNGKLLTPAELQRLAKMPSRNVALSMLLAVMKAPVGKLVRTLAAVRDQKSAAAA